MYLNPFSTRRWRTLGLSCSLKRYTGVVSFTQCLLPSQSRDQNSRGWGKDSLFEDTIAKWYTTGHTTFRWIIRVARDRDKSKLRFHEKLADVIVETAAYQVKWPITRRVFCLCRYNPIFCQRTKRLFSTRFFPRVEWSLLKTNITRFAR